MECDSSYACHGVQLYCPEEAECSMDCGSQDYVCDAELFISDPDGSYNESLLDISCEDDDCLLVQWWCPEIENTTSECTRSMSMPLTPLNCTSDTEHCQVCYRILVM